MKNFERKKVKVSSEKKSASYKVRLVAKISRDENRKFIPEDINIIRYVLDSSIIGKMAVLDFVYELINKNQKIVVTSLFLKDLKDSLDKKSSFSKIATELLFIIGEDKDHFEFVEVDEEEKHVDDCVMAYCCNSLYKVTLVVATFSRADKAKMYEVKHILLNENVDYSKICEVSDKEEKVKKVKKVEKKEDNQPKEEKFYTLSFIKNMSGELVISEFKTENQYICLYSKDKIYNDGIRVVHAGDEILVATKKPRYINFCHYRVCRLTEKENCLQLYHKKIYNMNRLKISSSWYKDFLNDFKKIFDL